MPRYVVERAFSKGLGIPARAPGPRWSLVVVERDAGREAVRKTTARSHLPVGRITRVRVLDPYFYTFAVPIRGGAAPIALTRGARIEPPRPRERRIGAT